ncbi:hypothetical protein F5888DRAFT_229711 [Russula emetica]|nr:hypothetical protein F5888DRAFT_229711 [Russula emetica]
MVTVQSGARALPPMFVRIFADLRVPKQPKLCPYIADLSPETLGDLKPMGDFPGQTLAGTSPGACANAHMPGRSYVHWAVALWRGCVLGRKLRRLLIDIPFVSSSHRQLSSLLHDPSCPLPPPHPASHSNFVPIFNAALESYKRKTKKDLASHPLLSSLQSVV